METKLKKIEAALIDVENDIMQSEKYSTDYKAKLLHDADVALTVVRLLIAKVSM